MSAVKKLTVPPAFYFLGLWGALVLVGLFTSAWIPIPFTAEGSVAVTLQGLFFVLAGLLLGPQAGFGIVVVYLVVGLCGLPVFPQGQSGLGAFAGAYGGYLLGGLACTMSCSLISRKVAETFQTGFMKCFSGYFIWLLLGALTYRSAMNISMTQALALGLTPFLPSLIVVCAISAVAYRFLMKKAWV